MPEVDFGADYGIVGGVGSAQLSLHSREVSEAERQLWAWEDRARDARRIPVGFRAPERKAKVRAKKSKSKR